MPECIVILVISYIIYHHSHSRSSLSYKIIIIISSLSYHYQIIITSSYCHYHQIIITSSYCHYHHQIIIISLSSDHYHIISSSGHCYIIILFNISSSLLLLLSVFWLPCRFLNFPQ